MKHRKKQWFALLASLTLALGMLSASAVSVMAESTSTPEIGEEEAGLTEENGEYWIRTAADLNAFAAQVTSGNDFAGKVVNLDADITADSDYAGAGIHSSISSNVKSFNGTLDGHGKTITLAMDKTFSAVGGLGIINSLGVDGTVKNLNVAGSLSGTITGSGNLYAGAVAAFNNGTIENCNVTADVKDTSNGYGSVYVGGISGDMKGAIRNCTVSGNVTGKFLSSSNAVRIGGIVGKMSAGSTVDSCVYSGQSVTADTESTTKPSYVGGITGEEAVTGATVPSYIRNCSVPGAVVSGYHAAGIAGSASGRLLNCFSTAVATGLKSTAGIAAQTSANTVLRNNYFAGSFGAGAEATGAVVSTVNTGNNIIVQNNYALAGTAEALFKTDTKEHAKDNAFFAADGTLTWQDGASAIAPSDASGTALADTQPIAEVTTLLTALQTWQQNSEENAFKAWIAGSPYPVFASDSGEEPQTPAGDLDGDGIVGNSDVKLLQQVALGKATLTEEQLAAVDFNGDGKITASDVLHLKKLAMGKL